MYFTQSLIKSFYSQSSSGPENVCFVSIDRWRRIGTKNTQHLGICTEVWKDVKDCVFPLVSKGCYAFDEFGRKLLFKKFNWNLFYLVASLGNFLPQEKNLNLALFKEIETFEKKTLLAISSYHNGITNFKKARAQYNI